jgi:ubiquinone/menaquinone biosynthesis C-methylase UbiE
VLDVGCGTGVITAALAERGCTVVGLDASEPYLEGARRDRSHPNIVYELGDARCMSYADASFDACVSALAIDVVPEVDQVVREMRRVTRVGGTVASSVFDFWGGFLPPTWCATRHPCSTKECARYETSERRDRSCGQTDK